MNIKLGSRVKDIITGYIGITTAYTVWVNGCVRYCIEAEELDKEGKPRVDQWFDEQRIRVLTDTKLVTLSNKVSSTGGPMPDPPRVNDPSR